MSSLFRVLCRLDVVFIYLPRYLLIPHKSALWDAWLCARLEAVAGAGGILGEIDYRYLETRFKRRPGSRAKRPNEYNKKKNCCGSRYVSARIHSIHHPLRGPGFEDEDEDEMPNAKREAP
jgi:hypothetical protein